jgi:hypothetical protein
MKRRLFVCLLTLFGWSATSGRAGPTATSAAMPDLPPPYVPGPAVSGTIRIWGHGAFANRVDFIEGLVKAWEAGFQNISPE